MGINDVAIIVDDNDKLWLNEKLDFKNLIVATSKYNPIHRKHRFELTDEPKNN